ncbi:D-glycero-beta-D-manno-heptose 1-phosphate adenylyltransferase [bacterium]|nr:D-glycero-beta-D-manno-heptose 1-phosphate adenylyltransferase [bacterium]
MGRLLSLAEMKAERIQLKEARKRLVFTNGVFDILHRGHCEYLEAARQNGDAMVVGLNSDASVRRLKGMKKPIVPEEDRAAVLTALRSVDYVVIFDDDTPLHLITELLPDILIKGGDYALDEIVGRHEVESAGGAVLTIPLTEGRSSTNILATIIERYCQHER